MSRVDEDIWSRPVNSRSGVGRVAPVNKLRTGISRASIQGLADKAGVSVSFNGSWVYIVGVNKAYTFRQARERLSR